MRRGAAIAVAAVVIVAVIVVAATLGVTRLLAPVTDQDLRRAKGQDFQLIERGRYLTALADCASCHTVPGENPPFAGGRPIETPFGVVVAANITPDAETGIGAWTDAQFDAAMRQGKGQDGELLYPAMPYPYYTKMSRDDVLAIRAYLDTIPPVRNPVTSNRLPFPFNIRAGMLAWNALYFKEGVFRPDSSQSDEWNRGAYIVEGAGHCGACHTPKTLLGGDEDTQALQGYPIQGWFASDITNDERRGLGRWNVEDIVDYLRSGHNRVTAATGPMAEEVTLSSTGMTDGDLHAIATYLKAVPGRAEAASPVPASNPMMVAGDAIYHDVCSACHAPNGDGVPFLFPSLANSSSVLSADPTTLIRVVLRGARSAATSREPTAPGMPPFGWQLDDDQIAAVLTYIRNSWGAAAPAVSPGEVGKARLALAARED